MGRELGELEQRAEKKTGRGNKEAKTEYQREGKKREQVKRHRRRESGREEGG